MVKVSVKWGKETIDVDVDVTSTALAFKETLFLKTGVPSDRQKITAKGLWNGTLKDTESMAKVTDGTKMAMIGTSIGIPKPPEDSKIVFVEDMTVEAAAKLGVIIPAGLQNLGNTCYMNSTLQCLKVIPELTSGLTSFVPEGGWVKEAHLTRELGKLYTQLDRKTDAVIPAEFVANLRSGWALFNETSGSRGPYKQQDAEEFFQTVTSVLATQLKKPVAGLESLGRKSNLIDALFEIEFEETMSNTESDIEAPITRPCTARKLICNVGGSGGPLGDKVTDMAMGIRVGLTGEVEKNSEVLGRNSVWKKQQRISSLPRYLCVQFMRFYWKATPDSRDHTGVACKILKGVGFPLELDVYEFCNDELQARMRVYRDKDVAKVFAGAEEGKTEAKEEAKVPEPMVIDPPASHSVSAEPVGLGLPPGFKGKYELCAAVTHKGRSSDSGHYIGWSRSSREKDEWNCFDDADVSPCKSEHILELKGGGDYDMAYILFYRYKIETD